MKKFAIAFLLIATGAAIGFLIKNPDFSAHKRTVSSTKKPTKKNLKIAENPRANEVKEEAIQSSEQRTLQTRQRNQDKLPEHNWLKPEDVMQTTTVQTRQVVLEPVRPESVIVTTSQPIEYSTTVSGYDIAVGGPLRAVDSGAMNPSWTLGENGLIQNPCVDPPSANRHLGRQ